MYGNRLGASEAYYGPPLPGQSFSQYQSAQESLAKNLAIGAGLAAAAVLVNPVVAGALALGWLASSSDRHMNKPKAQGG